MTLIVTGFSRTETRSDKATSCSWNLSLVNRSVTAMQRRGVATLGLSFVAKSRRRVGTRTLGRARDFVAARRRDVITAVLGGWGAGGRLGTGRLRLGMKLPGDTGYLSKLH